VTVEHRWVGAQTPAAPEPEREYKPDPAWDKLLLVVGAIAVAVALLVVPGILNRGGQNPIAEAAQATMEASGVRTTFSATINGPGFQMAMQGGGVLNGETRRAQVGVGISLTGPETRQLRMEQIADEHDSYLRIRDGASSLGLTNGWIRMSGQGFDELAGKDDSTGLLGGTSSTSPKELLDSLGAATDNVSEAGREQIGGVSTTHYTADVDLHDQIDEVRDQDGDEAAALLERTNPSETVDVWIDDGGLLRHMTANVSLGSLMNARVDADFSGYGIHPDIVLPPASQVRDESSLAGGSI
jgi:hypothetical protein